MNDRGLFSRAVDDLARLIFPPKCVGCGEILPFKQNKDGVFCPACRTKWEMSKYSTCKNCGMKYFRCRCASRDMYASGIKTHIKLVPYYPNDRGNISNRVVYSAKRENNKYLLDMLAAECGDILSDYLVSSNIDFSDVVITYPARTKSAERQSGYDQSAVISDRIGKKLKISFVPTTVRRGGIAQKSLDYPSRRENVKNSIFLLPDIDVKGKTVVIFDDVVTSGATMAHVADLLYDIGAESVIALSVAQSKLF